MEKESVKFVNYVHVSYKTIMGFLTEYHYFPEGETQESLLNSLQGQVNHLVDAFIDDPLMLSAIIMALSAHAEEATDEVLSKALHEMSWDIERFLQDMLFNNAQPSDEDVRYPKYNGITSSSIRACCDGYKRLTYGLTFHYASDDEIAEHSK